MRIAYVSDTLSIHDYRFLKKLCENGYETFLITYTGENIPEMIADIQGLNILHARMPWDFEEAHTENRLVRSIDGGCRFLKRRYQTFRRLSHFKGVLKKVSPDVVHGGWIQSSGFLSALSGFHPFLLMPWGSDVLIAPKRRIRMGMITKYTLRNADMITCDCEYVKKEILKLSPRPEKEIIVFPWGIEREKFNPQNNRKVEEIKSKYNLEGNKILINNRGFRSKLYGQEYFVEAVFIVKKKVSNIKILYVGAGPLRKGIIELVRKRGLEENFIFTGEINTEDMPSYLNASDIFVSTSLSDGTPACLLEAMSCGLPVVVTNNLSSFEWVNDGYNGFIVRKRDPQMAAEKILTLLGDENIRSEMGRENIKIAEERADWDKNFKKLEEMYQCLYSKNMTNRSRKSRKILCFSA